VPFTSCTQSILYTAPYAAMRPESCPVQHADHESVGRGGATHPLTGLMRCPSARGLLPPNWSAELPNVFAGSSGSGHWRRLAGGTD
jgi:hypothetical protein